MSDREDDKIIRNPARKFADSERHKTYVPEHKRLGKEPIFYEIKEQPPPRKKPEREDSPPPSSNVSGVVAPHPRVVAAVKERQGTTFPEQSPRVHVGTNQNWYDVLQQEEKAGTEEIFLDEVEDPPPIPLSDEAMQSLQPDVDWEKQVPVYRNSDKLMVDSGPPEKLEDVEPGNFCLVIRDAVVATSSSKEELESKIEQIIFGEDDSYQGITVNDILIFKRFPIKAGVLIVG